jgi:hypothetical protein
MITVYSEDHLASSISGHSTVTGPWQLESVKPKIDVRLQWTRPGERLLSWTCRSMWQCFAVGIH